MKYLVGCLISMVTLSQLFVVAQTSEDPPFRLPDSVQMLSDEIYSEAEPLRLDLFSPKKGDGPFPAVIFISCAGWRAGTRSNFWRQGAYLAERGFVAATTGCRPAPGSRYPTQLNDALAGIRWLRTHAKEHKVDAERIAVAGGSAGGHIAALIGANRWNGSDWSGVPVNLRVRAAVIFNGVFDIPSYAASGISGVLPLVRINLTNLLGATSDENIALWRDASPLSHITAQAAPFLLLHGTNDTTVPYTQALDMQRALRAVGVGAELFTAEGAEHAFFNRPPWYEPTNIRMAEFLTDVFKR